MPLLFNESQIGVVTLLGLCTNPQKKEFTVLLFTSDPGWVCVATRVV